MAVGNSTTYDVYFKFHVKVASRRTAVAFARKEIAERRKHLKALAGVEAASIRRGLDRSERLHRTSFNRIAAHRKRILGDGFAGGPGVPNIPPKVPKAPRKSRRREPRVPGFYERAGGLAGAAGSFAGGALLGGVLLGGGAVRGVDAVRRATLAVGGLHAEIENTEVGIAAVLQAIQGGDFTGNLGQAAGLTKQLRVQAAKAPGSLRDFNQSFQTILPAALAAGADVPRVVELNRLSMLAGSALNPGGDITNVGLDVMQALTQGAGAITTKRLNIALRAIGTTTEEFNALDFTDRLDVVEKALKTFSIAGEEMGRTWDAQLATLEDTLRELGRQVTGSGFDEIRLGLLQFNDWMEANGGAVERWAARLGQAGRTVAVAMRERGAQGVPGMLALGGGMLALGGLGVAGGAALAAGSFAAGNPIGVLAGLASAAAAGIMFMVGAVTSAVGAFVAVAQQFPEETNGFVLALLEFGTTFGTLLLSLGQLFIDNPLAKGMLRFGLFFATAALKVGTMYAKAFTFIFDTIRIAANHLAKFIPMLSFIEGLESPFAQGFGADTPERNIFGLKRPLEGTIFDSKPAVSVPPVTNINGPVSVTVRAERIENPNNVARSFEAAMQKIRDFPTSGRATLTPRPT